MTMAVGAAQRGDTQARSALRRRLESRLEEIEEAVLTRVYGIADPSEADPAYLEGLRASVSVALDYALEAIERGEAHAHPPPPALLAQARMAARHGVGLDVVLRRYVAGYTLIGDFMAREAELGPANATARARLLEGRAAVLDRLLAAVSEEYEREARSRWSSSERERVRRVERLLTGEPIDTSQLGYEVGARHLGLAAAGLGAEEALRAVAESIDCRLLFVRRDEVLFWAWLGSRGHIDPGVLLERAAFPSDASIALGEPAQGLSGWRLTHRQAAAALPVAQRRGERVVRYADVALLAAATQDDLLSTSLRRLYLDPLGRDSDRGGSTRKTLRAYFDAHRNITSAANVLGVDRKTVSVRLRAVETTLGRPLATCAAELETALALEEVERASKTAPNQGVPEVGKIP